MTHIASHGHHHVSHTASETSLTALPLVIQSHILSYLIEHEPLRARTHRWSTPYWLPFRDPSVTISLAAAETLTVPLPDQLLAPALASPILAAAAANLLGPRVRYLTTANTAGRLVSWLTAFAPYVSAISTEDPFRDWWWETQLAEEWKSVFEIQRHDSMRLLTHLSVHPVRLEVLDLLDVPFFKCKHIEDHLIAGLCAALESSSATLRELALPVFTDWNITDTALSMSTLKTLDVLTVKLLPPSPDRFIDPVKESLEPFFRMIRAVDGHADRSRKLTTLRELRLMSDDFVKSPYQNHITHSDRSSTVFLTVKTLRVGIPEFFQDHFGRNTRFLLLFKNLERLFLSGNPQPTDKRFRELCQKLLEVHLCGCRWITSTQVGAKEHYPDENLFFRAEGPDRKVEFRAIRTVVMKAASPKELRNIIKYCPMLEYLSVFVTRDNTRTLGKLIRKSERLKGLELVVSERKYGRLGAQGWDLVSTAIPEGHKCLCEVAIQTDILLSKSTRCVEAVITCLSKVLKAVGSRARRIAYRVHLLPKNGSTIITDICTLLETCIQHTTVLEWLEIDLRISNCDIKPLDPEWEEWAPAYMLHLENRLLSEVPSLRVLSLGIWHYISNPADWKYEIIDMVPIRSNETDM